jgi:hypothetical protein
LRFQRFATQSTRLSSTLTSKHVISGKERYVFSLDHDVPGQLSQPNLAQNGPEQADQQEYNAEHD